MIQDLAFRYQSTAKIRFKLEHCFVSNDHPYVYRIRTEKLDFTVPRKFCILGKTHVYVPNSFYQRVLDKFYQSFKN